MPDPTFNTADTNDSSLENFFSRPVKIRSYDWGTGTNLFETFNPWQDFWENPRVINRITNYNLLRCKMKVRFVLNGNGFHYGRAIASYIPLHNFDQFTKDRAFFIEDVVAASQRPHIYLDPTKSQGGTLTLPFVWEANALDIPDQDWRDMGDIIIHGMQNLKHANGATDSVTVSVFAWAEEVSLSIPTANEPGALSPQAGPMGSPDEYGTGPISRPASMIARAAGALANAPIIGLYAKATQIAANAASSIATAFGYSRPPVLADIQPYRPTYMGNMVNSNVPDSVTKLTYDCKQELSVDPRTMGLGSADEMTLKSIAMRESYLTQFPWAVSSATETLLWNTEVNPVLWSQVNTGVEELHFPASCFATLPFRNWRGTMKFRFQIVASSFHKGRVKIVYDPSFALTNEYNTNYTYIIDLAKERDFTVEIGWGQQYSFLKHRQPGIDSVPYSQTQLGSDPNESANGILSVYVVNELTVPNSTINNDVAVNVFVSAGEDFEVVNPDDFAIRDLSWFAPQAGPMDEPLIRSTDIHYCSDCGFPMDYCECYYLQEARECATCGNVCQFWDMFEIQSGEMSADADLTTDESAPMMTEPETLMGADLTCTDHTMDVFFGDPVTSFRQVLKRYNYHSTYYPTNTTENITSWDLNNFPLYRGYAPGAIHATSAPSDPTPYNYAQMTMLNWVTPAYTCWRGGMRWKYLYTGEATGANRTPGFMSVEREPSATFGYDVRSTNVQDISASLNARVSDDVNIYSSGMQGLQVTPTSKNPVLEVELPFHSIDRFGPAKKADLSGNVSRTWYHTLRAAFRGDTSSYQQIKSYCATGEDFTLAFFTGCPVCYLQTPVPPSTL